ncbi:MAG: adenylate/guanylate cyclase domain-containing protein [Acidimicrobiia bacterium]
METTPSRTEERKLVTVLFADVTGSTGLGERFDPEDLARVMSTYFEAMRTEIEAEGGTVEKFIGDAVMAVFGVPVAHEDDPARALHAATRMMDRLHEVNKELAQSQGISLEMRIGVNTGEVLAHTDSQPGEPMVTGDVVNVASRLQTTAQPGRILVAERTARAVRKFNFNEIGDIQLRGKAIPVKVFELIGHAAEASERGIPGLVAPMVGRDSELALLQTIFHRTSSEARPNLVTLYGEAGVGKSRLTAEFLEWVRKAEPTPIIVRGRCLPYGDGIAYWPLAEILKQVAGIRDSDPSSEALERIRALGGELLTSDVTDDPERTIAILANTIGVTDPDHSFVDLDPREIRVRTNAAWRSLFTALSAQAPVVAIVEDIHWADPALLDILEEMTEKVMGPLLITCPARPELTERRPGWGGGRRNYSSIFLDPLSPEESDTLVGLLLAIADLPAQIRRTIMSAAEGNPFFLEEIVRHLIDQGHIVRKEGSWVAGDALDTVKVPDTVQSVLAARIDLLGPLEKRVLQRAAVVGRIFWPSPVARLLDGEATRVDAVLDHLEERELIQSRLGSSLAGEPEFIFKHVLTREVAYEMLPRRERGAAHAAVATWIEESTGDRASELVELVAYHWAEAFHAAEDDPRTPTERIADLRKRAFASTLEASRASRGRAAVARARRFAEQAMTFADDPMERASAMNARGLAALFDYDGDVAWFSLKDEVDFLLEHAPEERRSIARACARAVETPFRWPGSMKTLIPEEEVIRYIEIGLANLDPGDESEEMVRLLIARAMGLFARWKPDEIETEMVVAAREAGQRAVEIANAIGRVDLASAALDAVGSVEQSLGDYKANTEVLNRRLPLLDRMANPWEIGDALAMGSNNFAYIGDYRQALQLAERGVAETAESSARGLVLHNTTWISYAEFWLGNWDRIVTDLAARVRVMMGDRANDPPYFAGHQFGVEAFIHAARRDREMTESRDLLTRMVDGAEAVAGSQGGLMFKSWEAWIRARDGDVTEALRRLDRLSTQARVRPLVDVVRAAVLLDAGLFTTASEFIDGSRDYAQWAGIVALPPHLDRLEAAKALADGDPETAIAMLTKVGGDFADLGLKWELARTELWLAEAYLGTGNRDGASRAVESARPVLEGLGSVLEIERARSLLKRL